MIGCYSQTLARATETVKAFASIENSFLLKRCNEHMKKKKLPLGCTAQLPCILQLPAASHFQMCLMVTLHPSKKKENNSSP